MTAAASAPAASTEPMLSASMPPIPTSGRARDSACTSRKTDSGAGRASGLERPERQIVGHRCQCPGPLHAGIARHPDQRPGPQRLTGLLDIAVVLTQMHGINAQLGGQSPVIVHDQQRLMSGTDAFQAFQLLPLQRPVGMLVAVLQDADAAGERSLHAGQQTCRVPFVGGDGIDPADEGAAGLSFRVVGGRGGKHGGLHE